MVVEYICNDGVACGRKTSVEVEEDHEAYFPFTCPACGKYIDATQIRELVDEAETCAKESRQDR